MRLSRHLLASSCAAVLLSLTACSHPSSSLTQAAAKPAAKPAETLAPLPAPTTDERLALALDHLGARHGPRGEVLTLSSEHLAGAKLEPSVASELKQLAAVLRDYPKADVQIEGYTDNRGSKRVDDRLSLEHADTVKQTLIKDGLEATRLSARGLGPDDPIADNHTRTGREQNRRVELVFSDSSGNFVSGEKRATSS
jgi:outer membrane protein OmpA-like peptidoglycan-associated protein